MISLHLDFLQASMHMHMHTHMAKHSVQRGETRLCLRVADVLL
jgi:hypothetical protein